MTQLQPVADISDPTNITIGNPDLNPRYTNNVFIRFQQFTPEKQRAFMIMANGSYIINDIVSYTSYNQETGVKTTTYKNVNGNYSGNVRMMLNTPLKNKKFSINSMTMASFANSNDISTRRRIRTGISYCPNVVVSTSAPLSGSGRKREYSLQCHQQLPAKGK